MGNAFGRPAASNIGNGKTFSLQAVVSDIEKEFSIRIPPPICPDDDTIRTETTLNSKTYSCRFVVSFHKKAEVLQYLFFYSNKFPKQSFTALARYVADQNFKHKVGVLQFDEVDGELALRMALLVKGCGSVEENRTRFTKNFKLGVQFVDEVWQQLTNLFSQSIITVGGQETHDGLILEENAIEIGPMMAKGGMGVVYKGKWLGIPVAIKQLRPELHGSETSFFKEMDAMRKLRHPNTISLYGILLNPLTLVMPLYSSGSLDQLIEQIESGLKVVNMKQRLGMLLDIARGMAYIHSLELIHGDLKPQNVLIADNGSMVVSDFGLAKLRVKSKEWNAMLSRVGDAKSTMLQSADGYTPLFAAPEMIGGKVSRRSDVFAFGLIACNLLFPHLDLVSLRKRFVLPNANLSAPLLELLGKCLSIDVNDRPHFPHVVKVLEGEA